MVALFLLVGCNDTPSVVNSNSTLEVSNNKKADKTIIKYTQSSISLTSDIEAAIMNYNENYSDGYVVELIKIPTDRYNDTINMLLSSGEGPDVFEAQYEWLHSYILINWLYDLKDNIDDDFLNLFPKWAIELAYDSKFNNHLYSFPSTQSTFRLIYNKDLFRKAGLNPDRPPETLDDLMSYAEKITEVGRGFGKYGFGLAASDIWNGFVLPMEAVNSYSGVYFFDYGEGKYDLNVYKPWFKTLMGLKEGGNIFPGEMTMKEDLALLQFAEGNIGMMYAESNVPILMKKLFSVKCDWDVAMPPIIDKNYNKGYIGTSLSGWQVVNEKTPNPKEAIAFWKYLYSQEYNTKLFKGGYSLPIIKDIMNNNQNDPFNIPKFDKFMPSDKDIVFPSTPLDIDECVRGNVYNSIFKGSVPLDIGLANETYRLNMLLDKYKISGKIDINKYIRQSFGAFGH